MTLHRHKFCGYTELAGLDDGFGQDDELGQITDLIGAGASLLGGLFGGGKKHGGSPAPTGMESVLAMAPMMEHITDKIVSSDQIKNVVRDLLATVPPPVKEQVLAVIKAVQAQGGDMKHAEQALVSNIEAKFMPAIKQSMDMMKLAHRQRTATSEHKGMMKDSRRWSQTLSAQRDIVKRIKWLAARQAAMQSVIDDKLGSATVLPKGKVSYLGGKRFVDLLASKRR